MLRYLPFALLQTFLIFMLQTSIGSGISLAEDDRPNIVYILLDDLGFGDLQDEIMPKCSELARRGSRMNFYSHQTCLTTRTALFTGLYPRRLGLQRTLPTPINTGVPTTQKILSEHLSEAGYSCGMFGKWHLGSEDRSQWPTRRGFDEFVGLLDGHITSYGSRQSGLPYADGSLGHGHHGMHDIQYNEIPYRTSTYSTELFANFSKAFIRKQKDADNPFFLYVPFNAPHAPYSAPREYVRRALDTGDFRPETLSLMEAYADDVLASPADDKLGNFFTAKVLYRAMLYAIDDAISDIYEELETTGQAENTIFVISSDNGVSYAFDPRVSTLSLAAVDVGSSGPLRGQKGSVYEGGTRVANFIVWPGVIEPEQEISSNIWIGDLTATFLEIANVTTLPQLDGTSIMPAVTDDEMLVRPFGGQKILPVNFRTATAAVATVVYQHRKYIRTFSIDQNDNLVPGSVREEMFNLRYDIGETLNLVNSDNPFYQRWLAAFRVQFEQRGGDQSLINLNYVESRVGLWKDFEFTPEFRFPAEADVLETCLDD